MADISAEDVHNHIPIVQQHPLRRGEAFNAEGGDLLLGKAAIDVIRDGANLAVRPARTDYQIIGYGGELPNIKDHDVVSFFLERRVRDSEGPSLRIRDD